VSWDARWTYLESYPEITQPEIYTPRQFRTNGWKIPLVFYVHQSLNVVTPRIPLGTVLPGAVWGEQNEHELVCRVCYGRPIAGYPFCNRTTAGVMHGRVAAELHLLDQL
jgi:hypothetical protein